MMRKFLTGAFFAAAAVAATGLAGSQPSEAANRPNPWCLKAVMGRGWVVDMCYFRTFAQCSRERFNYGPTSFCIHNPELYWTAKGERREPAPSEFP